MASQPLETINEVPTTPATPPNSPTPARVTADPPKTTPVKTKSPGHVASGKRLAERNRLAREAKKKEAAEAAANNGNTGAQDTVNTRAQDTVNTGADSSSLSLTTILGFGGLIVAAAGVYYQREAIKERFKPAAPVQPVQPAQPVQQPVSRIPVKRGIKEME